MRTTTELLQPVRNRHLAKRARFKAYQAQRKGKIRPPLGCQLCAGREAPLQKHHVDYAAPLDVIWLCPKCHLALHRLIAQLEAAPAAGHVRQHEGACLDAHL